MKNLAIGIIVGVAISEGRNFIKRKKEDIYFEKEWIISWLGNRSEERRVGKEC